MIDKAARQKRLKEANKFLHYLGKERGDISFYQPGWWDHSKIALEPIGDGYRQATYLFDGGTGKRYRTLQNSRKLKRAIGERPKRIVVTLAHWIMNGQKVRLAVWRHDTGLFEKSRELGIVK